MPDTPIKKLVVGDDAILLDVSEGILADLRHEWDTQFFMTGEEALSVLARSPVDLVVHDIRDIQLAGMSGIHFLPEIKNQYPHTIRIACSRCAHPNTIHASAGRGASVFDQTVDARHAQSHVLASS